MKVWGGGNSRWKTIIVSYDILTTILIKPNNTVFVANSTDSKEVTGLNSEEIMNAGSAYGHKIAHLYPLMEPHPPTQSRVVFSFDVDSVAE